MATTFGKLDFHTSFKPSSAFPLDSREYFESYDLALEAAKKAVEAGSSDSNYYYGQVFRVVENGTAQLYQVQPDNTLAVIGSGTPVISSLEEAVRGLEKTVGTPADTDAGIQASGIFALLEERPTHLEVADAIAKAVGNSGTGGTGCAIERITISGTELLIEDKTIDIPIASDVLGVVKSNENENGIVVDAEGAMAVHSLNVDKLVQDGDLVLMGGGAV